MLNKTLFPLLLVAACAGVQAQSTPAKKELVARILKVQQPAVEAMARNLAEQPAIEIMSRAGSALPARVAADKRDAVAKDIQADVKKYVEETVPLVQSRAVKLMPTTIGAVLEEKFSEDELKQVAAFLESPAYTKFTQAGGEMQKAMMEKLLADSRSAVEPKVRALEQSVGKRLGATPPAAAAAPVKPASK